jgi:hypothetical protein
MERTLLARIVHPVYGVWSKYHGTTDYRLQVQPGAEYKYSEGVYTVSWDGTGTWYWYQLHTVHLPGRSGKIRFRLVACTYK